MESLLSTELYSVTCSNGSSLLIFSPFFLHCQLKFWNFWNTVCWLWLDKNIFSCELLWFPLFSEREFTRFPGNFCNIFCPTEPLQQNCFLPGIKKILNGFPVSQATCCTGLICCSNTSATISYISIRRVQEIAQKFIVPKSKREKQKYVL